MLNAIKKFFYRTDWVLLGLCLAASIFGIVIIASASNYHGASTYVSKQIIALVIGLILFVVLSFLDIEILAEHQTLLVIFSAVFLAMLYPFGVEGDTGNRSWMSIPGMPFMIQPAEYCKIIYIIVCARIMTIYQEHINSLPCVLRLGFVSAVFMGLIVVISKDAGVALIYVFTLIIMALAGGFSFIWFAAAGAGLAVIVPILWNSSLVREDQKNRVMVLFDESIDPLGTTVRYQASRSINAISGGGLTGQGLFQGTQIPVRQCSRSAYRLYLRRHRGRAWLCGLRPLHWPSGRHHPANSLCGCPLSELFLPPGLRRHCRHPDVSDHHQHRHVSGRCAGHRSDAPLLQLRRLFYDVPVYRHGCHFQCANAPLPRLPTAISAPARLAFVSPLTPQWNPIAVYFFAPQEYFFSDGKQYLCKTRCKTEVIP